jgi:hypothetical protein
MTSKKKRQSAKSPVPMKWEFGPDIPTDDFLDGRNLDELWDLQEAVDIFVSRMNEGMLCRKPRYNPYILQLRHEICAIKIS